MQLIAYGAQDYCLHGTETITFWKTTYRRHKYHEHEYYIDECMAVTDITTRRTYRNVEIQKIIWYEHGNASFTVNKYKEVKDQYNNLEFITMNISDMLDFKIEKGNKMISKKLKEQDKKAKELRERNRKIDNKIEKQKKKLIKEEESIYAEDIRHNRKCPRRHKRFFYGK